MGAAREMGQADFDLERFIDMFDTALTSKDERVVNALRSLMMMVILTNPESQDQKADGRRGPLRQLQEDVHNLNRRLQHTEDDLRDILRREQAKHDSYKQRQDYTWDISNEDNFKNHLQDEYIRLMKTNKI